MLNGPYDVRYEYIPGEDFPEEHIAECSTLFSGHYGRWSASSPVRPGRRIKLGPERIARWIGSEGAYAILAWDADRLVAYAFTSRIKIGRTSWVTWVTQLVVDEDYRNFGIAKEMLGKIWGDHAQFGWGLVTANPYAVRALEAATRRRCDCSVIARHAEALHAAGAQNIPYISGTRIDCTHSRSAIDTQFFSDRTDLPHQIENARREAPWTLGSIEEGEEWLAFTFRSQAEASM